MPGKPPPPLPPPLPEESDRFSPFDWKPYARAVAWMIPGLVMLSFCSIVLGPRLDSAWEESLLYTDKPVVGWMRALVRNGGMATLVAFACLGVLVLVAEGFLKGQKRVRKWGCGLLAYGINGCALLTLWCGAVVGSMIAPVGSAHAEAHRSVAALAGTFDAAERMLHVREETALTARVVEAAEVPNLNWHQWRTALDGARMLVEFAEWEALRMRALDQTITLLDRAPDHVDDEESELLQNAVLRSVTSLRSEPFEDFDALKEWHRGHYDLPPAPVVIVE